MTRATVSRITSWALAVTTLGSLVSAQSAAYTIVGHAPGDRLGASVSDARDVDADGFADFVVGAWGNDRVAIDAGMALVLSGRTGSPLHEIRGIAAHEQLGWAVAAAWDVDKDGHDDLIVGAPGAFDDRGLTRLVSGADGSVLRRWFGSQPKSRQGFSVEGVGDWNLDGWNDLMVGEPEGGPASWSACIFSGKTGETLILYGGKYGLGRSVALVGDVGGDDAGPEVVLGRFEDPFPALANGMTWLHGKGIWEEMDGDDPGDYLGWSVDGAGDVDGDGVPDVVSGAPGDDPGALDAGSVRVHSGADQSTLYTFAGAFPGGRLGWCVSGAGDVDGDGHADLLSGAPFADTLAVRGGRVVLWSGADGRVLWSLRGEHDGGELGAAVSRAGDVNGDGFADWIVGEPGYASGRGRALVFLGSAELGM